MKVIKRDGRAVEYDKKKIEIAIEKANKEVKNEEQAKKKDINRIIKSIESMDKKRILVEDIQDIIEEKLMELGKFNLAKKYIVYRYTRALVRKQNTTDESILGIIKNHGNSISNSNSNYMLSKFQRNLIVKEVSKDLTKRMLLPEKIVKAEEKGIIFFHNSDYFVQPMILSSFINIKDMLENGTIINNQRIEQPKSFLDACIKTVNILSNLLSCQIEEVIIDLKYLASYLNLSKQNIKKELKQLSSEKTKEIVDINLNNELKMGIKALFDVNIINTANGEAPKIYFILDTKDENKKENIQIIEEIINYQKNYNFNCPKLIYVLNDENNLEGNKYDYLTQEAIAIPDISLLSEKVSFDYFKYLNYPLGNGCFLKSSKNKNGGKFNQGMVSINLAQIGLTSQSDEKKLFTELEQRMELSFESLMSYYYAFTNAISNTSPLHFIYGGIYRLNDNEVINKLLKKDYSSINLNYVGLYELTNIVLGKKASTKSKQELAFKILNFMQDTLKKWQEETSVQFNLCSIENENINNYFYKIDSENNIISKNFKNYNNINYDDFNNIYEKLEYEKQISKIQKGNFISSINFKNLNENEVKELINYIYKNILYSQVN